MEQVNQVYAKRTVFAIISFGCEKTNPNDPLSGLSPDNLGWMGPRKIEYTENLDNINYLVNSFVAGQILSEFCS